MNLERSNTILDEIIKYSNDCISGEIPSCQKHKWACMRFLKDLKRVGQEDFAFLWDESEAEKIVKWFNLLRHSKGILSGQPIELTAWQKFNLCQIYGWRHKGTKRKRFKVSFTQVGRKNAKSQMLAGQLLYEISVQAIRNNEVYETYCAGTKREQSKIIFNECGLMLKGSPLSTRFRVKQNMIIHMKSDSFLKPLSKEDGRKGDGSNPAVLVLDEYHQHATTEFYDLGLGSNAKETLLSIITTAGVDLSYPCYSQEYLYSKELLNPDTEVENDSYFSDICEIDEGDDLGSPEVWKKANPIRAYYQEGLELIAGAYKLATEVPEKMIAFKTKVLNVWVQAKQLGYMDMNKWKNCEVKEIQFNLHNRDVYVGFDMSAKTDLTSVAFVIPVMEEGVPKYVVYSHSFIPNREKLQERKTVDKMPYDSWEERGFLTITDSPIVDQNQVMKYVEDVCKKNSWRVHTLCFDPSNASKIMMDLAIQGYECVEVYQSHKSLNESTAGFREQVYCRNVLYTPNPLLNFAMGNAVIKQNNGLIKIDKDATAKRIDPVDAVLCAFKLAMYYEFELDLSKYSGDDYLDKLYG